MSQQHNIIKLRRGTAAEWRAANELLSLGEPGFEKDTYKLKIGDGITLWNDLPYIDGGFGGDNGPLEYVYDIDFGSDSTTIPSEISFNSLSKYTDYSTFYNDIKDNNYKVSLKLTRTNHSEQFFIAKSESVSKNYSTGEIDAFWPSSSIQWISDGGADQYDSANFINNNITTPSIPNQSPGSSTLRDTSIPYGRGIVVENSNYWGANDYVTLYKKSIFAMVARGNAITMPTSVYYAGNAGADGDGDKDIGILSNFNGYQAGYCRIWGDDPTYTKLIITKIGTVPTYSTDNSNDTDDDLFVASNINSDTIAMVVFYADDDSNPSSLANIQTLFESFVTNVLIGSSDIYDIKDNFYNNHNIIYDSVNSSFWYENFEFFTGTNGGSANSITAEQGSGSGLIFNVLLDQDIARYVLTIDQPGMNYQANDIIVLRGNFLNSTNGRSPDEDIYVIINSVDIGGEVLTYSTITNFTYTFNINQILARSDGFRFIDNEKYYLNIDIISGDNPFDQDLNTFNFPSFSGVSLSNGSSLSQGSFDNELGGNSGISLVCGVGYELNWQAGHLKNTNDNGITSINILADSAIEFPGENSDNMQIDSIGLTFSDGTTQITSANNIIDNAFNTNLVAGSGIDLSYSDPNLTISVSGIINNPSGNRLLTSRDNSTTGIDAESNLTFDGSLFVCSGNARIGSGQYIDINDGLLSIRDLDNQIILSCEESSLYDNSQVTSLSWNERYLTDSSGNTVLWWDNPIGIGIKNNTPSYTLDVIGSGNFSSGLYISNIPVSISGHTHAASDITDFNSAVSGLLPVKNITAGTGISVGSISGVYTITSTGSGVLTDQAASVVTTVFNNTGSPIPKMTAVYIDGGQGDQPTVALAVASGEMTSSKTYGITYEAISNMNTGKVVVIGVLTGLNTDQFNPTAPAGNVNGTTLWLSPTTPGGLTTTKPSAPNHAVAVGTIVRTHQNAGVIEVRIQNGYELEELHNVAISGVTNGQFLQYNSASGLWVPSSSGNFTTLQVSGTNVSLAGHTHTISNITDFPTIANSGDNRVLTSTGSSTGINAESNLTFNGTTLGVTGILDIDNIRIDGNTLSSTNADGNILLSPSGNGYLQNLTNNIVHRVQRSTNDNNSTTLTIDGASPGASNTLTIPTKTTWTFVASISAYNDTDSIGAGWIFRGTLRRNNSSNTVLVGSIIEENWIESGMSGTSVTVSADNTNQALQIDVVGLTGKNIKWVGVVNISQITYV